MKRTGAFDEQTKSIFIKIVVFLSIVWLFFVIVFKEDEVEVDQEQSRALEDFLDDLNNETLFGEVEEFIELEKPELETETEPELEQKPEIETDLEN